MSITARRARRLWAAALALALGTALTIAAGRQLPAGDSVAVAAFGEIPLADAVAATGGPPAAITPVLVPTRIRVPALDVDAAVVPIGVDRAGALAVPADGDEIGWWARGAPPGTARGTSALIGHVDTETGPGALFSLREVRPGDRIQVWAGDQEHPYRVEAVRSIARPLLAASGAFDRTGAHRLVVITCGGPYDPEAGGYRDNVVVYAVPEPDGSATAR